jgi:phosphopantothenoylcysteine decarboxylase/phosphopantothenate--cysteine ligase
MGSAMSQAALDLGHDVVIVSGPVELDYPNGVEVIPVISTQDMFDACVELFPGCDGAIGVAAPCDYRPLVVSPTQLAKTGAPLQLDLFETRDIIAHLGASKRMNQWVVGFALETHDERFRALAKLEEKACDLIILNRPEAMDSPTNQVELLDPSGQCLARAEGSKQEVARELLQRIQDRLIQPVGN